jgi:hypothetical protein
VHSKLELHLRPPAGQTEKRDGSGRLNVDTRHLYLQANKEARFLGDCWKRHIKLCGEVTQARARPHIEAACQELLDAGRAISLREIEERVPREILVSVERLFDMLQDIKQELRVS